MGLLQGCLLAIHCSVMHLGAGEINFHNHHSHYRVSFFPLFKFSATAVITFTKWLQTAYTRWLTAIIVEK